MTWGTGGNVSMAAFLIRTDRPDGRAPVRSTSRAMAFGSQYRGVSVEILRIGEDPASQEGSLGELLIPLHHALALRVVGLACAIRATATPAAWLLYRCCGIRCPDQPQRSNAEGWA